MRSPQIVPLPLTLIAFALIGTSCDLGGDRAEPGADRRQAATDSPALPTGSAAADSSTLPAGIRRLPPDSFPFVPDSVRLALDELGCSVPQAAYPVEAHNVVSGELAAAGQRDWAALCARGDSTGIVVVWGGPARCDASLAWAPYSVSMQSGGGGEAEFSRAIGIATMVTILRRAQAYDGPDPPARDHAGLDDIFVGKASIVRFCHDGEWIELQGAD